MEIKYNEIIFIKNNQKNDNIFYKVYWINDSAIPKILGNINKVFDVKSFGFKFDVSSTIILDCKDLIIIAEFIKKLKWI